MSDTENFEQEQLDMAGDEAVPGGALSSDSVSQALGYDMADRRIAILRGIAQSGSISQAARDVGVSYKAAWQAIDTLTNLAGVPLVERSVGGAGGGGAQITPAGEELLHAAEAMMRLRSELLQRMQAGTPGGGQPNLGLMTSMRNQWPCSVLKVESIGGQIRVWLRAASDAGSDWTIAARITPESYELLGLAPGVQVLALCKATAVKVWLGQERPVGSTQPINIWPAVVQRATYGAATVTEESLASDEAICRLSWGAQIVGFAPAMSGLVANDNVWLEVAESAVVVAVASH
ncbi:MULTISPECIES: molybdenum-dependent transcriptional regulator [Comamonas]|uniref:molybdenum-dependent transcriptional regulator n=1 Tax=Comamonas TaxID=283 RepID=UPI0009BD3D96|nr:MULTISPECIES: TOBE domain-containing protein [Comamonas]UUE92121.1 LysR family transcriptional regulator [Comamonas thiooxydans]